MLSPVKPKKTKAQLAREIAAVLQRSRKPRTPRRALEGGRGSLQVGRDEPSHRPQYQEAEGPGGVYLTPAQRRKLFGGASPGQVLGRGKYASVFATEDPRRVVKLTHDASDAAALVRAKRTGVVPALHAAYKLEQPSSSKYNGGRRPVYALVLDRLTPVPPEDDANVLPALRRTRQAIIEKPTGPIGVQRVTAPGDPLCETPECLAAARQLVRAVNRLRAVGISWTDLNVMNLGYDADGTLRVLDVGAQGETPGKLPVLASGSKTPRPPRPRRPRR